MVFTKPRVSYFEIYNEMIYDLLVSPCDKQQQQQQHRSLHILETDQGIQIKGLRIIHVHSEEEAINLFFEVGMSEKEAYFEIIKIFAFVHDTILQTLMLLAIIF